MKRKEGAGGQRGVGSGEEGEGSALKTAEDRENGRMGAFETRCKGTSGSRGTLCREIIVPLDSARRRGTARFRLARLGWLPSPTMKFVALPANFQPADETYDRSSNPVFIWKQRPRRANQRLSDSSVASDNCDFRYISCTSTEHAGAQVLRFLHRI